MCNFGESFYICNYINSLVFLAKLFDIFRNSNDNTIGIKVIIGRFTFTQKFGREEEVELLAMRPWGSSEKLGVFYIETATIAHEEILLMTITTLELVFSTKSMTAFTTEVSRSFYDCHS